MRPTRNALSPDVELLCRVGTRLAISLDPGTVLKDVVDAACQVTRARYGALVSFDDSAQIDHFITRGVSRAERRRIGDPPRGLGLLGNLHNVKGALRIDDISLHPDAAGFPYGHPPMKTFLGAPISWDDQALGFLCLTEKRGGAPFTLDDEQLLVLLTSFAAIAIRNARLYRETETEKQRLATLLETVPVGIFAVSRHGEVLMANAEVQRILGVNRKPSLDDYDRVTRRYPDGTIYQVEQLPLRRALDHGETVHAERVIVDSAEGRHITALVDAAPLRSSDGQTGGGVAVLQDISLLEDAETMRHEFLGTVAKGLKTPLSTMVGALSMALRPDDRLSKEETKDLVRVAVEQSEHLCEMVDSLLDLSRIQSGSLKVDAEPTDLRDAMGELLAAVRQTVPHEVNFEIERGAPLVKADRHRLAHVLRYLIGYVAKHSQSKEGVTITARRDGQHMVVAVGDGFRGVSSQDSPLPVGLLDTERAGPGTTHVDSALVVCRGIVEAHGGRLRAAGDGDGKWRAFSFSLPIAERHTPDSSRLSRPLSAPRLRVLAVDDDPLVLRMLRRQLSSAGHHVSTAGNPNRVHELMRDDSVDLLLLALQFPDISGFDVLREVVSRYDTPVIILTVSQSEDDATRALEMGAADYIRKPYNPHELMARMAVAMRHSGHRKHAPATFELDGLRVDYSERCVFVGDRPVELTPTQFRLLAELTANAGHVVTYDDLLTSVWGEYYEGDPTLVRSFVRDLRRQLADDAEAPRFISTVRGVGYRIAAAGLSVPFLWPVAEICTQSAH